jgi:hypothetical protein
MIETIEGPVLTLAGDYPASSVPDSEGKSYPVRQIPLPEAIDGEPPRDSIYLFGNPAGALLEVMPRRRFKFREVYSKGHPEVPVRQDLWLFDGDGAPVAWHHFRQ